MPTAAKIQSHSTSYAESPHLVFNNICKKFPDGASALEGVSATINKGEFCVILGQSGSGKSTLLRAINGLTVLSSGELILDSEPLTPSSLRSIRRRVAMVHQHFNLVERASVASNVLIGAVAEVSMWRAMLGWYPTHLRNRACQVIERVGLDESHLKRRASALSGGQQQRVGIARALILSPEIILADEPVASLDPAISREILSLIRTAALEQNATVLCSLHQIDLAREYADRIIGLRKGRIIFDGPAANFDAKAEAALYGKNHIPTSTNETAKPEHV